MVEETKVPGVNDCVCSNIGGQPVDDSELAMGIADQQESYGATSRFRQIEQETPCRHNLYLPCTYLDLVLFISRHHCTGLKAVFRHYLGQSCELSFPGLWFGHRFADLNQHA